MSKSSSEPAPLAAARRRSRTVPRGDPFTLLLRAQARSAGDRPPTGANRFNGGEHLWLGGRGASLACRLVRAQGVEVDPTLFQSIARRSRDERLSYGEVVALSGDFYRTARALYDEKPAPAPWLWEGNDLSDLREIFAGELSWIEEHRPGQAYPEDNVRLAWNAKTYLELALDNVDHFGWHNVCRYVRAHRQALSFAVQAGKDAKRPENETFRKALYFNGFADHFLTDGFAAGHIRVPRAEIIAWGRPRRLSRKATGALSKLLHDQDGHVDELHGARPHASRQGEGLPVRNARGDAWHARCDGQLFLEPDAAGSEGVEIAVEAVAASVAELLVAWKTGRVPEGTYEATRLVPFPDPGEPGLAQKFPADAPPERIAELHESMQWFLKLPFFGGVRKEHLGELFAALPKLMGQLRLSVAAEAAADPEIKKRIAPGYVEAFRAIR